MATIYQKIATDKQLILDPREGYLRQFSFTGWTELRLGIYFSGVAASGDNTASVSEDVTYNTYADKIYFGIKNSDTVDLPGHAAASFLGLTTQSGGYSSCNGQDFFSQATTHIVAGAYHLGTLINGASGDDVGSGFMYPTDVTGASGYNGFIAVKFVITNLGTSSQTVTISKAGTQTVTGTDYSSSALRTAMNSATYGTTKAIAWNDGASAYTIPDGFFIRMPFYNNRIRISALRAIRYA